MTNDNKKINELVSNDEDPTDELQALPASAVGEVAARESDADTFEFEEEEQGFGEGDQTIAELQSELRSRADAINKLQFDMEQLRAKWTGLEKEIKVREEVTRNLTQELKSARKSQASMEKLLGKREKEIESLKSELSQNSAALDESVEEAQESEHRFRQAESRLTELESALRTAQEKLDASAKESDQEQLHNQATREHAASLSSQIDDLHRERATERASARELQEYVDRRKSEWDKQEIELNENRETVKRLSQELDHAGAAARERDSLLKEIAELRKNSNDADATRAAADRKLLAERSGQLAGQNYEISELTHQIARTEAYADELRRKLQDQLSLTDALQTRQKHLEASLAESNARVSELGDALDDQRATSARLADEKAEMQENHQGELRRVSVELGNAQETIAVHESLNEQLTSDLVGTRQAKINLEAQLKAADDESKATIAKLNKKLQKAEMLNEELKDKLDTKNSAITALLDELTKRSEAAESINEIEDVIHELDDRISERIDDKGESNRERVTRLLIGDIDGQELRFPLFKDRLTIGRTVHNDIQLKTPYISRRHAVVVTDERGTRIVDWGSKNGIFVNAKRIEEQTLQNGDIVTIGTAEFMFEERPKR